MKSFIWIDHVFSLLRADMQAGRLELARQLGATHTVLFREDETDARTNAQRLQATVGEKIDVAMECSGAPICMQTSVYVSHCPHFLVAECLSMLLDM